MSSLLEEQSALLKSGMKLTEMIGEQTAAYVERSERLRHLSRS
jgi:hypothetical protein